jgi:putative phage-type endonuclease
MKKNTNKYPKFYEIEQRSEEWFNLRKGKLTASNAQCIATNGRGLESYVYSIVAEEYSIGEKESYTNEDMQRGVDLEDQARTIYEMETGATVAQIGFIENEARVGCSPDGLVDKDGGIEIKCPNNVGYIRLLVNGEKEIKADYIWQVQMSLLITGREWWDLIHYNPNFKDNIQIHRIFKDQDKFEKLKVGIENGKRLYNQIINKLK